MSTRESGRRFEKKIQTYLESLGFVVDRARASVRFIGPGKFISSQNDFWGYGDHIAVHPKAEDTLVIQATTGTGVGQKQKKAEAIPWNLNAQRVQIWMPAQFRSGIRVLWLRRWTEWEEHLFRMKIGQPPSSDFLGLGNVPH